MARWVAGVAIMLIGLAFLIGGAAPFGRVALTLGMPGLAATIFDDPAWRGVAFYRAADYDRAADAFAQAGPEGFYNLGNAQAQRRAYAASLEAFDLALSVHIDPQAQANFDLLRGFYAGTALDVDAFSTIEKQEGATKDAPIARGDALGSGSGDDVTNTGSTPALAELVSRGQLRVRRVFDDTFVAANDRWLATLEDVPGAYLAARIDHEHKRRRDNGTGQEQVNIPW